MKAIVYERYGSPDVLELRDVEKPTVTDDGVLVRIRAASTNPYDWHFMRGKPYFTRLMFGLLKPKAHSLGADLAGEVEAVGKDVTRFRPGDAVFGEGAGAFAEFACVPERWLARKPTNLTFEQAAAVPMAAVTALQGLRDKGGIAPGKKVLINGAGGGVGTFAVQIAKAFGAEVTAVCGPGSQDLARSLGADRVLDYTKTDLAGDGRLYDLIYAVNGDRRPSDYLRALNPGGICVVCGGSNRQLFGSIFLGPTLSLGRRKKIRIQVARMNQKDLAVMAELLVAGKVLSVIDRRYPLSETAAAMRYLEEGHAKGKIVITM